VLTKCVIAILGSSVPKTFKKSIMKATFRRCAFLVPNVMQPQITQLRVVIRDLSKEKSLNQRWTLIVYSPSLSTS